MSSNLHEFQAKDILKGYGVPVPAGIPITDVSQLSDAIAQLMSQVQKKLSHVVIKAQVHSGARGKAGGVCFVTIAEAADCVRRLLGTYLVTHQTGPEGLLVHTLLICAPTDIDRELYFAMLVDRTNMRIGCVASAAGGIDIETIAQTDPQKIANVGIQANIGICDYHIRTMFKVYGLVPQQWPAFQAMMKQLYRCFVEKDLSLLEINPLVVQTCGTLTCLDAKITVDENALFRQESLAAWMDPTQMNAIEVEAAQQGLNYIALDGNIGCMVNGAGLAMATMDIIHTCGGRPANFLDVGGTATKERVEHAFRLLCRSHVKAILVNIFGGIVRCDMIAEGILAAIQNVKVTCPIVVRLSGNSEDKAKQLLANSGLSVHVVNTLAEAAQCVVSVAV
jgi:succinyl-CoA synthetase beta subunit